MSSAFLKSPTYESEMNAGLKVISATTMQSSFELDSRFADIELKVQNRNFVKVGDVQIMGVQYTPCGVLLIYMSTIWPHRSRPFKDMVGCSTYSTNFFLILCCIQGFISFTVVLCCGPLQGTRS